MTGATTKRGELIALPRPGHGRAEDLHGTAVSVRAELPWLTAANDVAAEGAVDLSNVIPFRRARAEARSEAPQVAVPAIDVAKSAGGLTRERVRLGLFAAISLAAHAGLLIAFWHEPDPLASVGVQVISVEIVVGSTAPAGFAAKEGQNETQAVAAPTDPQPTEQAREAEQRATEQPQEVPVAKQEAAPAETTQLERQADEAQPADNESAARTDQPAEPKAAVAMVESPQADMATATPRETPPDSMDVTLLPQPEQAPPKPVEAKPVPQKQTPVVQQKAVPTPKQVQRKVEPRPEPPKQRVAAKPAETKDEAARIAAPTRDRASRAARASTPASPSNSVGIGRSDNSSNYRGIVWAHLARHKQSVGNATGTASVAFTVSGSGGVSSVRLARSSGNASIDAEVQSMVRRASPFPPPPGGQAQSFAVPVRFQ